jgi:Tfp pilus assembly protein PilF
VATGQSASAEREYRTALEADPQSIPPRLGLALLWARAGNLPQAEAECLEILKLEPQHAAATRLLARIRVDRRSARPHGVNYAGK